MQLCKLPKERVISNLKDENMCKMLLLCRQCKAKACKTCKQKYRFG